MTRRLSITIRSSGGDVPQVAGAPAFEGHYRIHRSKLAVWRLSDPFLPVTTGSFLASDKLESANGLAPLAITAFHVSYTSSGHDPAVI
jgi:hypothetical protein